MFPFPSGIRVSCYCFVVLGEIWGLPSSIGPFPCHPSRLPDTSPKSGPLGQQNQKDPPERPFLKKTPLAPTSTPVTLALLNWFPPRKKKVGHAFGVFPAGLSCSTAASHKPHLTSQRSQTTSNFPERCLVPGRKKTEKTRGQAASKSSLSPEGASLVAQAVKNPPAMREKWVRSLGGEDPLEEGMGT